MNQILYTKSNKKPTNIKSIVKVFAIILIIFGVIILGQGVYSVATKKEVVEEKPLNTKPSVEIEKFEDADGSKVRIYVTHNKNIMRIIHRWNEEEDTVIEIGNKTSVSEEIELPIGENTLYVSVIDEFGVETKYEKEYIITDDGDDVTTDKKPTIVIVQEDTSLKFTITDDKELKSIKFSWDEEEESVVKFDPTNSVEFKIDVPAGEHDIYVIVEDSAGNKEERTKTIIGKTKPKITVYQDGNKIMMKAEDEIEMGSMEYTINGEYLKVLYKEKTKTIEYFYEMKKEGYYGVFIKGTNIENTVSEFEGNLYFKPEVE